MPGTLAGARVGAILSGDEKTVQFLGYGIYIGHEHPPAGFEDAPEFINPKILLDDGRVVWGYQCWWGPEQQIRGMLGGREIEMVTREIE